MDRLRKLTRVERSDLITYAMVIVAFVVVQLLVSSGNLSSQLAGQLIPICAYICMAVSLNLVVGISGELSLGHAGFMSVGAFAGIIASAALSSVIPIPAVRLLASFLVAGLAAGIAGFLVGIPVMRLQGDYLAIVTLAFGEIIKNLLNNLYAGVDKNGLHFSFSNVKALGMDGGKVIINGPMGAVGIEHLSSFVAGFLLILFTLFVVLNLVRSRSGRAIMAVRDNRIAAESVGINTTKYRLMAFVVASALAGMAGALYAQGFSTILPKKFDFNTSILILVFVVLGGMGNIRGSIISAALLTILPEVLRFMNDYRMLLYAIVLIVVMIVSNNETLKQAIRRLRTSIRPPVPDSGSDGASEGGE